MISLNRDWRKGMGDKGLHIQMFSIHGLVRSENMQLGYDADTGGQIRYVIELGRALSENEGINRVDLFTRLISDKSFSDDYSRPVEEVNDRFRIVRVQCGGRRYMRKELLWPHLDEYVDKTIKFIKRERAIPDIVHGHYPDAGYVAGELARIFGIPFVYTGHSLGRSKKERLLNDGYKIRDLNKQIKIDRRIEMEERILQHTDLVITSTRQERDKQYGQYRNGKLPNFRVMPPGIDIEKFEPYYHDSLADGQSSEEAMYAKASVIKELNRFLQNLDKPVVLALCRPDKRKNIEGLIKAFGEDRELQAIANLAVFAGIRKDIAMKEETERDVLTRMLLLMDKYDLYGKMAVPKAHDFENEVPELYKVAAERGGVFVNAALTEPFGLTLLEASATGLPIVATNDGGPIDIIGNCKNGYLVDPLDTKAIARAVRDIIVHEDKWAEFSKNGVINTRRYYTWANHAETYAAEMEQLYKEYGKSGISVSVPRSSIGKRLARLDRMIITDIDNTLLGGGRKDLRELMARLKASGDRVGFGVATGRVVESAMQVLEENEVIMPDVIISAVGSEIYYYPGPHREKGWETHIAKNWNRQKIVSLLDSLAYLELQEEAVQRPCKISYNMAPGKDRLAEIHNILTRNRCHYTLIYSHEKYLDILPYRASKGKAMRYLSYKWEIPLKNFLVCGDSGNDEEMLRGEPPAVVVGNYSSELEKMRSARDVYFARREFAGGMIEGIEHYNFLKNLKAKNTHDN